MKSLAGVADRRSMERTILLTGGTGMVGGEVCKRLLAQNTSRIYVLTRKPICTQPDSLAGARFIQGDMVEPGLGLLSKTYESLQAVTTEIVHCAADTRFGLPLATIREPNVTGTSNILGFALGCRKLEKFIHISTAYVAGRLAGSIPEKENRHNKGFFNTYQQSKYEAEALVLDAIDRLPAAILRLSSVVGNSTTGRVTAFNYIHQLLRLFPRNLLPIAPGLGDAPVDLIPTEWTADAIVQILTYTFRAGEILHLCSGVHKSLTVRELMDITIAQFEKNPVGRTWLPIQLPELVSLNEFEAFVVDSKNKGDKLLNLVLTALGYFLPHLAVFQAFETEGAAKALASSSITLPHALEYFPKVVQYCLDTNWVGKRKSQKSGVATGTPVADLGRSANAHSRV